MDTIGVDTGGTFTDLVAWSERGPRVLKLPSTPADPGAAVAEGLLRLGGADRMVHGTTVALNALLTGQLAPTALVTNRGFEDLLEIGRQERPELYAPEPQKPPPLVPEALCFGIDERTWPDPETARPKVIRRARPEELAELARAVKASGARAVAICLLHSVADRRGERAVERALAGLGLAITRSADLVAEQREVERFTTAVVNAGLRPVVEAYLRGLSARLGKTKLHVLRSSGGFVPAAKAALEPVRVLLSGPAGGVVGAREAARQLGLARILTLDIGGTSADVAFARTEFDRGDGAFAVDPPPLAGRPIAVPSLDVHTIGCGGGSILAQGAAGTLEVGPKSAGADPGPAAHGRGGPATLTDAHLVLGHIHAGEFLSGEFGLDRDAALCALEALGARLGCSAVDVALSAVTSARAAMRRAAMVMSSQRGLDPAQLALLAFGGGGGLHAAALGSQLGSGLAVVPSHPGALSALGMCLAEAEADRARSVLAPLDRCPAAERRRIFAELSRQARAELRDADARGPIDVEAALDLCYRGQSFELRLAHGPDPAEAFHRAHERLFGYALREREVLLVSLSVRAVARRERGERPAAPRTRRAPASAHLGVAHMHGDDALAASAPIRRSRRTSRARVHKADRWARAALPPGARLWGPARIEEYSGTTLVPPGWSAQVAAGGHLLLRAEGAPRRRP